MTDLEAHGGLYVLHSHVNHSCAPNVSVRHLEQRTALARISMIALQPIASGEELCITYVNPALSTAARRQELYQWAIANCSCSRCVQEEFVVSGEGSSHAVVDGLAGGNHSGLEQELRAGLGVS